MRIYSIGYQKLELPDLVDIVRKKEIDTVLDLRSKPYSRKVAFNRKSLENTLPATYYWVGKELGGLGEISDWAIMSLAGTLKHWYRNVLFLCMEHHPKDCHRHYEIGRRLLPFSLNVVHLIGDREITAQQMEKGEEETGNLFDK